MRREFEPDRSLTTPHSSRCAVFLDRDGVLNRDSDAFIRTVDELEILPGVPAAIRRLNDAGLVCAVITNQSGIARGLYSLDDLAAMHDKLNDVLAEADAHVDAIYSCPHGPDDGCDCRKPAIGMVRQAESEHPIDLSRSWLIGDRPADIECGRASGCRTILVLTGKTHRYDRAAFEPSPDHVCPDLGSAVDLILSFE